MYRGLKGPCKVSPFGGGGWLCSKDFNAFGLVLGSPHLGKLPYLCIQNNSYRILISTSVSNFPFM